MFSLLHGIIVLHVIKCRLFACTHLSAAPVSMPTVSTAVRSSRGRSDAPVRRRGYGWVRTDAPASVSLVVLPLWGDEALTE